MGPPYVWMSCAPWGVLVRVGELVLIRTYDASPCGPSVRVDGQANGNKGITHVFLFYSAFFSRARSAALLAAVVKGAAAWKRRETCAHAPAWEHHCC